MQLLQSFDIQFLNIFSFCRLIGGDRPYWWVSEAEYYNQQTIPTIRHYPNSCVSAPPSATHTLIVAGVGMVFVRGFLNAINTNKIR